jgi:predicted PurR-regulated permease PerM
VLLAGALGAVLAIPVVALVLEAQRIFMAGEDAQVALEET